MGGKGEEGGKNDILKDRRNLLYCLHITFPHRLCMSANCHFKCIIMLWTNTNTIIIIIINRLYYNRLFVFACVFVYLVLYI